MAGMTGPGIGKGAVCQVIEKGPWDGLLGLEMGADRDAKEAVRALFGIAGTCFETIIETETL
jgi:hypothetical protein